MTDIETPPLSGCGHPAGEKQKETRHVAFSDVSEGSTLPGTHPKKSRKSSRCSGGSCCFVCCAWLCLGVVVAILGMLVLGVWFVSFIKSDLPEVRVHSLSFRGLRVANSSKGTQLDTGVEMRLNVTNKNSKTGVSFEKMTAEISLEDIRIGRAQVSGLFQEPRSQSMLKIATGVTRSVIPKDEGEGGQDVQSNAKNKALVLDVVLNGRLGLDFGSFKLHGLPFKIGCTGLKQAEVDLGLEPRCSIRVFAFK